MMAIPKYYRGRTVAGLTGATIVAKAQAARDAVLKGLNLFLTGKAGTGKTHVAVALLSEWYARQLVANKEGHVSSPKGAPRFIRAIDLLYEIKQSWCEREDWRTDSELDIINRYSMCPLLLIDDLGAEKSSEWSRSVFYNIIDKRHIEERQTIITSNMTLQQIGEQLDDRIASRIIGTSLPISMGEADYRLEEGRALLKKEDKRDGKLS